MKPNFFIVLPALILVASLGVILINSQRGTRDHGLNVMPKSVSSDSASTVIAAEDGRNHLVPDLSPADISVEVQMVKTDKAHLRELGFDWLQDRSNRASR